ncbi:DNA mismatch repair protein MutT, partial [Bacillus cereus]
EPGTFEIQRLWDDDLDKQVDIKITRT